MIDMKLNFLRVFAYRKPLRVLSASHKEILHTLHRSLRDSRRCCKYYRTLLNQNQDKKDLHLLECISEFIRHPSKVDPAYNQTRVEHTCQTYGNRSREPESLSPIHFLSPTVKETLYTEILDGSRGIVTNIIEDSGKRRKTRKGSGKKQQKDRYPIGGKTEKAVVA